MFASLFVTSESLKIFNKDLNADLTDGRFPEN
jgi:hypothetical protein